MGNHSLPLALSVGTHPSEFDKGTVFEIWSQNGGKNISKQIEVFLQPHFLSND